MMRVSLKACRVNAGMTQGELAEALGTTVDRVTRWEEGHSDLSVGQLRRISELSGIPVDAIYIPETKKSPAPKG